MAYKEYEAASPLDVDPYLPPNNNCVLGSSGDPLDPHKESYFNNRGSAYVPSMMTATAETSALLSELLMRSVDQNYYLPLYQAAERGDWKSARSLVGLNTKLWTAWITTQALTVQMVAARACQWQFVQKLVELLPPEALAVQDINGCTVLHYVALGGGLKTAKALVRKSSSLQQIANNEGHTPLLFCLLRPHKEMVWYLSLITRDEHPSYPFTGTKSGLLVAMLTGAGFNDITVYLLRRYPTLAFAEWNGSHLLVWLSYKSSVFLSRSELTLWERLIYKFVHVEIKYPPNSPILDVKNNLGNTRDLAEMATSIRSGSYIAQVLHEFKILLRKATEKLVPQVKRVQEAKLQHTCAVELVNHVCTKLNANMNFWEVYLFLKNVMYFATISGIVEIVSTCLQHFPDLIFEPVANKQNILHVAIECRQDKIFNLINAMPLISTLLVNTPDGSQNNILHLTAKLAPSSQLLSISGAALQMQRELQWFKEVEKLIYPTSREETNLDGTTAKNIFWVEHKDLAEKGEKWMKDTSNSCMVVSTLIATVVFAAAFTVPGGNASDIGIPIFLSNNLFIVFAISDALALLSSSTSLLMFLSILTARYAQEDFLHTLPKRLIIGLGSLFFSIITMMVAFGTTLFIVLDERWRWVSIPIILLASIPVTIFAKLQLPLFIDMVQSTYGSGIFIKKSW